MQEGPSAVGSITPPLTAQTGKCASIDFMKLSSFNVCGLGGSIKRRALSKLIRKERPDCILIQETKMQVVDQRFIARIWSHSPADWNFSPAVGTSAGILTVWNSATLNLTPVDKDKNFNWIKGSGVDEPAQHQYCEYLRPDNAT